MATREVERHAPRAPHPGEAPFEDRWLVLSYQAGDTASYGLIHQRYRPQVESLCRRLLGNYHDAEEATQETFLRVFKALPRFNGQYRLRPWILRIATNVSLDMLRTRARLRGDQPQSSGNVIRLDPTRHLEPGNGHAGGSGDGNGHNDDPFEIVERRRRDDQVREVLGQLPEHYRTALVLREFEGLSYEEIGAALGESPARVKALLHRAKKRFRRTWDGAGRSFGLIPLPLIAWIRRLSNSATEISVPLAGPPASLAGSVAASGAAPLISTAAERVVATVAAVAVTGALGLGVARGAKEAGLTPEPSPTAVVTQAPQPGATVAPPAVVLPPDGVEKMTGDGPVVALPTIPKETDPVLTPSEPDLTPPPVTTPPPDTSPGPGPSPTDPSPTDPSPTEPAPPILTAPPYSAGFVFDFAGAKLVLHDVALTQAVRAGSLGERFWFSQTLEGTGTAAGRTWFVQIELKDGQIRDKSGRVLMFAKMTTDGGVYQLEGTAGLASSEGRDRRGIWRFTIAEGMYEVTVLEGDPAFAPQPGVFGGTLAWFEDGTEVLSAPYLYE